MRHLALSIIFAALIGASAYYLFAGPKKAQKLAQMSQPKETAQTEQQALSPTEEAAAPQQKAAPAPSAQQKPASNPPQQIAVPESELKVEIVKEGAGTGAKSGDSLSVHYTGTFLNGTKFDSSRDRGIPFTFTLGAGQVILGWDVGLEGMRIGEARKLTVPPQYGYGSVGTPGGPIPPNATLLFEVELLGITSS